MRLSLSSDQKTMKPAAFAAPPLNLLLREVRALADLRRGGRIGPALRTDHDGQGHNVLVVPGFLAADGSTVMLRRTLNAANYRSHGWGLGRNFGIRGDILHRIDRRMDEVQHINAGPVTLIGWSLGGLIAREYAKHAPDRVTRVITLGTPFSGDLRANHAWRIYELIAGHRVDAPPLPVKLTEKPPVPTYAIWSRNDGVVDRHCARGLPHESDVAIEVGCGHMGFTTAPDSIAAIFRALQA